MKTETLSIDLIRLDGGSQARIKSSEETIEAYAELIDASKGEWPFGPLDVFHDGTDYFVADGFHRTLAAQRLNRASIPCNVHKGTAKDAKIFGMTANDKHGLRMSQADKRSCVIWLLANGPKLTQAEIAEKAGVSVPTVKRVVSERKPAKGSMIPSTSKTQGKSSQPKITPEQKAAEKEKKKAEDDAAKARRKEESDAAKLKKKEEASAVRAKEKADAKAAKDKAKADAASEKLKALPKDEQISFIKSQIQQHLGKMVRLLDELNGVKPNRLALNANLRACEGIKLW